MTELRPKQEHYQNTNITEHSSFCILANMSDSCSSPITTLVLLHSSHLLHKFIKYPVVELHLLPESIQSRAKLLFLEPSPDHLTQAPVLQ